MKKMTSRSTIIAVNMVKYNFIQQQIVKKNMVELTRLLLFHDNKPKAKTDDTKVQNEIIR